MGTEGERERKKRKKSERKENKRKKNREKSKMFITALYSHPSQNTTHHHSGALPTLTTGAGNAEVTCFSNNWS